MLLSQGIPPAALGVPTRRRRAGRDRRPGDLAAVRRALAPVPRHAVAAVAGADLRDGVRRRHPAAGRTPPTRSTTRSPPGWPSRSSGRGRCSSGSTSRCSPPPSPRWTTCAAHAKLAADGWGGPGGRVITTFRPDDVVDMEWPGWAERVDRLGEVDRRGHRRRTRATWPRCGRAGRRSSPPARPRPTTATPPRARWRSTPAEAAALFRRGLRGDGHRRPTPRRSGRTCWSSSPGCPSRTVW